MPIRFPIKYFQLRAQWCVWSSREEAKLLSSSEPHRIFTTQQERDECETKLLSQAIKELIKKELSSLCLLALLFSLFFLPLSLPTGM